MKKLYTYDEISKDFDVLSSFKKTEEVGLECSVCKKEFKSKKNQIYEAKRYGSLSITCSRECYKIFSGYIQKVECKTCNREFIKRVQQIKLTKGNFCSKSCAATFNNTHKTHGTRRSKLEIWLEEKLKPKYGESFFEFNQKSAINSELDIYCPSLKLAVELNGIFHYEPIYSAEKLKKIQNNDGRKYQACLERGIELCIIDVSKFGYFKPSGAQKFLDIICNIVDNKLSA
jgi:very-short-patch-repair endonuclease